MLWGGGGSVKVAMTFTSTIFGSLLSWTDKTSLYSSLVGFTFTTLSGVPISIQCAYVDHITVLENKNVYATVH